ncbi:hypothetical protein OYC64_007615 [Pagothenia borchgrevinki]|uniref:Uncharacterized protein n=1 Tax=Pagothenia borchgrevinki TaxID=8213 RepID=A0ABD2GSP0_PAGBO
MGTPARPLGGGGVCGFGAGAGGSESEVQGDMNQRITPSPPPREKKSSLTLAFLSSLFPPCFDPSFKAQQLYDSVDVWLRVWIHFIIQSLLSPLPPPLLSCMPNPLI